MSTPAQSKIEFTAHLIKISSQIWFEGDRGLYSVKYIALLVIKHILKTQKWAAQHSAPLRFGEQTKRVWI